MRAKLRSSIKRLLVKYGYPPDKQPRAIKLVMEQMESMAPRYSEERTAERYWLPRTVRNEVSISRRTLPR